MPGAERRRSTNLGTYRTYRTLGLSYLSFQLMIELNTMLNSPWFCQR